MKKSTVFVLTLYFYQGRLTYPKQLEQALIGIFNSLEHSEKCIHSLPQNCDYYTNQSDFRRTDRVSPYVLELKEYPLNTDLCNKREISRRTYEPDGTLKMLFRESEESKPFFGRPKESIRYKPGDIVEHRSGDRVELAVVFGVPADIERAMEIQKRWEKLQTKRTVMLDQSDDCYLVDFIGGGHTHPRDEALSTVKGRITARQKKALLKIFENPY